MTQLATGTLVDRYTVEAPLGEGGMAVVYRVRHSQLGTRHALKVLSAGTRSIRDRMLQEGRIQAALRHPNIVAVTDVITVDDAPGLVMEYVSGPSLERLLQHHHLTTEQADAIAIGVLQGVAHAHGKGLIHRDLKPANVLLEITEGGLVPKVADFGLAKLLGEEGGLTRTRSGVTMGTPAYMAPEQIRDARRVDARADVFSLGCILYELVTGRRPFQGDDILALFTAIAAGQYTPPRQLVPDIPSRHERAIVGALQIDREQRIASSEQLLAIWRGEGGLSLSETSALPAWSRSLITDARSLGSASDIATGPVAANPAPDSDTFYVPEGGAETGRVAASRAEGAVPFPVDQLVWHTQARPAPPSVVPSRSGATLSPAAGALLVGVPLTLLAGGGLLVIGLSAALWWAQPWAPGPVAPGVAVEAPSLADAAPAEVAAPAEPVKIGVVGANGETIPVATAPAPQGARTLSPEQLAKAGATVPKSPAPAESAPRQPEVRVTETAPEPEIVRVQAPPKAAPSLGPPAGHGRIKVAGGVKVRVRNTAGAELEPGDLPAGTYEVHAWFEPDRATRITSVTLGEGETRTVTCYPVMGHCSVSR